MFRCFCQLMSDITKNKRYGPCEAVFLYSFPTRLIVKRNPQNLIWQPNTGIIYTNPFL